MPMFSDEQPLGEHPELAGAYRAVDTVVAENLRLRAELEKTRMRRDDLQAELDNMYPFLRAAEEKNAAYARELELLAPEVDRLQDANTDLEEELVQARSELDAVLTRGVA